MPRHSRTKFGLPVFRRTPKQASAVRNGVRTAKFIQSLWGAASRKQRRDPKFLCLLVKCGWTTPRGTRESRVSWRNANIAAYLGTENKHPAEEELARQLSQQLRRLSYPRAISQIGRAHV